MTEAKNNIISALQAQTIRLQSRIDELEIESGKDHEEILDREKTIKIYEKRIDDLIKGNLPEPHK